MKNLKMLKKEFYDYIQVLVKPFYTLFTTINNLFKLKLDVYVIGSGISSSIERYFIVASRYTLIAILIAIFTTLLYTHYSIKLSPLHSILLVVVISLLMLPTSIEFTLVLPRILYSNRGSTIEPKAILLLSAIALLLTGGQSIQSVIENLPKTLGKDYRYFSIEIDYVKSITRLGTPLDVALMRAAEITPSPTVRELLSTLASILNIGGDTPSIIRLQLDRYIARYEIDVEKAVENLNVYMEIFVALALLIPVLIGSIAILALLYPLAGISFEYIMFLSSFILLPLSTAIVIVLADTIVARIRP